MNAEVMAWVSVGLTVLVLVVVWLRTRPATVAEATAGIQEASETAKTLVMAAQQLWQTGVLPKDARLDYVLGQLQAEYDWLEPEQARATAEAAVFWMKNLAPRVVPPK